jgi:predicted unusual protein kinase regulating ubiquinone biosynthesis (AarF/ABC1/UbiB family)
VNRADGAPRAPLDRRRFLRVAVFLLGVLANILWWDMLMRRLLPGPVGRAAPARWRTLAERFRALAVSQGGVLIKLGQFLSIRVDVLPRAVTGALAGLQDEVPPEPLEWVRQTIAEDFGRPADEVFARIEPSPLGAASLAQVHAATLPNGEHVVAKVERRGIATLVETDLAAIHLATALLGRLGWVRRRADMEGLFQQFATTTRAELDFQAEGHNTETFARLFPGDPRVRVPRVYWGHTRPHVLTLEDVSGIKITDTTGLAKAGIDRREVARAVVDLYLEQVFVHNFVHADPHPGNLFVLPRHEGNATRFSIAFVDFGMTAVVPERVRQHLRDFLLGLATRDAGRMVRAYDGAGLLLPGADQRRLEQATAALLERFWGVRMGDLEAMAMSEASALIREFGDLLLEMPFQLPTDLLFVGRAMGMLSGLATELDPDFDFWAVAVPYARRLVLEEAATGTAGARHALDARWDELRKQLHDVAGLVAMLEEPARSVMLIPGALERIIGQAAAGRVVVQIEMTPGLRADFERIGTLFGKLVWAVALAGVMLVGAIIRLAEGPALLSSGLMAAAGVGLVLVLVRR